MGLSAHVRLDWLLGTLQGGSGPPPGEKKALSGELLRWCAFVKCLARAAEGCKTFQFTPSPSKCSGNSAAIETNIQVALF